ncbi:Hypothetical predicted protein [Paramuricea clavata]|uniref:Uncharacterized protein n=1 Tax=Paramuricea clavata TaxID=317549 RepID=A0A6S7GI88_PARCT|nr:Hypothetical predicted protein [Paramuricea clavata]
MKEKLQLEKKRRLSGKKREQQLKESLKMMYNFDIEDSEDFEKMFSNIDEKKLSPDLKLFWQVQKKVLETKDSRGNQWHPKIIRLCLSLWIKSPKVYEELRQSGVLVLPSGRLLSLYKNAMKQKPGLNDEVLEWMSREADKLKLDSFGREGGLILDKMAIQEGLQLKFVFLVQICCHILLCDGGESNRGFIKMQFGGKNPEEEYFTVINPYTRKPLIIIFDFPHNVKKLRNNVEKSRPGGTRNLTVGPNPMVWNQWVEAFKWDQKNSLPVHHRLGMDHFELGYATKMRNHLAEVLNKDRLNLTRVCY